MSAKDCICQDPTTDHEIDDQLSIPSLGATAWAEAQLRLGWVHWPSVLTQIKRSNHVKSGAVLKATSWT